MKIACIGSGLTGSVIARQLAEKGYTVDVFEKRDHIAGNCYTEKDKITGVTVHKYGAHIFKTNSDDVWRFVNRFSEFEPYRHKVIANTYKGIFSLPINLFTLNQFFNKSMNPREAAAFISTLRRPGFSLDETRTDFESTALRLIGEELYYNFFKYYTEKQWGRSASDLSGSVFKRLPIRFNYDDSYHQAKYSAMPTRGYTSMMANILNHENIKLIMSKPTVDFLDVKYDHIFYTGEIDLFFDYRFGRLDYRSLKFNQSSLFIKDYQGASVINDCTKEGKYTRVTEHKHFLRSEKELPGTVITEESSCEYDGTNEPYYPISDDINKRLYRVYADFAKKSYPKYTFCGRLGSYRYFDMDDAILEAMKLAKDFSTNQES